MNHPRESMLRFIFRRISHAVLLILLIAALLLGIVYFFPEPLVSLSVSFLAPDYTLSIGSIVWNRRGATMYDVSFNGGSTTATVLRAGIAVTGFTNGLPSFSVELYDGDLFWTVPPPHPATSPAQPVQEGTSLWWQLLQSPCDVSFKATNISVHIASAWLSAPLHATLSLSGMAGSTALHNRVQMQCSSFQPLKSEWSASLVQHSNVFDVRLDGRALTLSRLLKEVQLHLPLPLTVSKGTAEGTMHATLHLLPARILVTNMYAAVGLSGVDARLPAADTRVSKMNMTAMLKTKSAWQPGSPVPDRWSYLFSMFKGTFLIDAGACRYADIAASNLYAKAQLASNTVYLVTSRMRLFGGIVDAAGELSRRKVLNADYSRFKYDILLHVTNLNAGTVCSTFKLRDNRLEGIFNGELATSVFHTWVKTLHGSLSSAGSGTFYFPESKKYVGGMQAGMDKQLVTIMTDRLKDYPYDDCRVSFDFDNSSHVTTITFKFKSAYDSYEFPIMLHMSWINALKLIQSLQF